jgi:hypothetical protein
MSEEFLEIFFSSSDGMLFNILQKVNTIKMDLMRMAFLNCNVFRLNRVPNCLKTPERPRILDLAKVLPQAPPSFLGGPPLDCPVWRGFA